MRIITGTLKGRQIPIPDSGLVRPTADRTKEGIFSVISARRYFDRLHVLDLFAGSGNLGFEAISRGVAHVTFVDREPDHTAHLRKLAEDFKVTPQTDIITRDVHEYLHDHPSPVPFDLIFADPPYDLSWMTEMTEIILEKNWLHSSGWLILEHDRRFDFEDHPLCKFSKAYGRTVVSIFTRDEDAF